MSPIVTGIILLAGLLAIVLILLLWELRYTFQPGKIWVAILGKDNKFRWYFVRPNGNELRVKIGHKRFQKYTLNTENLVRTSKYNVPVSYHLENKMPSINFSTLKADGTYSAAKFEEATENHVGSDVINSLESSPQQMLTMFAAIVCIVVLLAAVAVAYDVRKQVKTLAPEAPIQVERIR